jgi:hypothetical protein
LEEANVLKLSPELRNRRRDQRFPVRFDGVLIMGSSQWPVTVRDLSENGAKLSGSGLPPIGSHVVVALAVAKLRGTLVWNTDDRCGLALSLPIQPLQVVRDMMRLSRLEPADPGRVVACGGVD